MFGVGKLGPILERGGGRSDQKGVNQGGNCPGKVRVLKINGSGKLRDFSRVGASGFQAKRKLEKIKGFINRGLGGPLGRQKWEGQEFYSQRVVPGCIERRTFEAKGVRGIRRGEEDSVGKGHS